MYSHGWGGVILHAVSFRLYDLRQNGFIQREEVSLLVRLNHTYMSFSLMNYTK